jgi:hypothetical protein
MKGTCEVQIKNKSETEKQTRKKTAEKENLYTEGERERRK